MENKTIGFKSRERSQISDSLSRLRRRYHSVQIMMKMDRGLYSGYFLVGKEKVTNFKAKFSV